MMMHHQSKFGNKGFIGSEDIFWTKQTQKQVDMVIPVYHPPPQVLQKYSLLH